MTDPAPLVTVVLVALFAVITVFALIFKSSPVLPIAFDTPPPQTFSSINLRDFIEPKVVPKVPTRVPNSSQMEWDFDKFGVDGHKVSLRLVFSDDEKRLIEQWGLNEIPIEQEPLFDEATTAKIIALQQKEIEDAGNDKDRIAGLRIEHRQQLNWMKEQTWGLTIEYYEQWPYVREFETRGQAREYYEKLDRQILPQFKKKLEEYGKR